MNPQKKLIQEGERHLAEKKHFLEKISRALELENKTNPHTGVMVLLEIEHAKFQEAVATITQRLEKLQKDFLQSFEAQSAEVNQKLGGALMMASQLVGKEPLAITEKIGVLAAQLKTEEDQEAKNDLFYEMMGHVNFIKQKVK